MGWLNQLTTHDWMLIGVAGGAFVLGFLFARVLSGAGKTKVPAEDRRDHRIRELEADLRLTERKLDEATLQLESATDGLDQSMATVHDLNAMLAERDQEVDGLRSEVKGAVRKTRELRRELTERAEENLREHIAAKEARDELDIVRAGSDALISEFERVQKASEEKDAG